ncbi:branched-chain amino acid ABC transporter substrate-binding protein [Brenneria tiliae]|uniref:Branched-chain amino acid ABC transporter substrate-binding protein n=1 Tax=Brenneria tiliae TaxID=2914984 RepID=A0ABT0MVF2_9GAMM|nr:branched-chain amino acid ABC transporter substrate-binding protein [Brenneria tiliae]MCL2893757.1 branched-chain amino acid ABC transporter substrate-binding protein [Brenneria tiliae]
MSFSTIRRTTIGLTVAALALACAPVWAQSTLKIAVAGPMTGANASFGEQLRRGAAAAVEDINQAGGVNGKKLELVVADDACDPKQAVSVASRLAERDKVVGVVGHFCSSSTIPASDTYAEADVLMVTPGSTNPLVTTRKLPNVMRVCGRDDQQGDIAGDYIVRELKAARVAIVHDKDTYGKGLADATKARLNALGVREVLYEGLSRGEKDFNSLVTKIKGANVDVVYFGGLTAEGGALLRQLREQGVKAVFMGGDGLADKALLTSAGGGANVNGMLITFGDDPREKPEGQAVVQKLRQVGYEPEGFTLYSYAGVQTVAAALKGAQSTSGAELADWLKKNQVQTVLGTKSWDANGDLNSADYVVYQWKADGSYSKIAGNAP